MARVEEWAASTPRRLAVVGPGASLTYAELALRARRQAGDWTRTGGGGRRDLVASCPVEVAVAVVSASAADMGLILLDAAGRSEEHERARAAFRSAPPTPTPGLGLTSSGVDGLPKVVERPWSTVTANAVAFAGALSLAPGETTLCTTPPHHSYAVCAGITTCLTVGATYVGTDRRTGPKALASALDEHGANLLFSVPLLYQWYAGGLPAHSVPRLCVSAGAPLTSQQRAAWERGVGWLLGEHFGTSEYGMLTLDPEGVHGSVGRAVPGIELSVDTSPVGDEVVVRCVGEPSRLLTADGRAQALDGPRRTGDLGTMDAEGRLTLLGRVGGIINIAGNKVSAAEVEAAARQYAPVLDCAVVGDASVPGATRLCLLVETGRGEEPFDRRELMSRLSASLASYKVPQAIYTMEALPRSAAGKVLRSELLRMVQS